LVIGSVEFSPGTVVGIQHPIFQPCFRVGVATPTGGAIHHQVVSTETDSGSRTVSGNDVFTFVSAGTFQFGMCLRLEVNGDDQFSGSMSHVSAIVYN
jgi:hypothetical protein